MFQFKSAKIFFFVAVLFFVAKPFLGFSMIDPAHPPAANSILLKSFTKRKLEFSENSSNNIHTIQKKLADPVQHFSLLFSFLLCALFPLLFAAGIKITAQYLRKLNTCLSPQTQIYLLNRTLLI